MNFVDTRRTPINQDEFDTKFKYNKSAKNRRHSYGIEEGLCFLLPSFKIAELGESPNTYGSKLKNYFPIFDTFANYSPKEQFGSDFHAGVCLGFYTVAESLAYAFLAGLPPICGLYTALISTLLNSFIGKSAKTYISSNLIVCYFVRNVLERVSKPHDSVYLTTNEESNSLETLKSGQEQIDYSVSLTFMASILLVIMYTSRLRFLLSFISKQLLGGFSFGLTVRVLFSQIRHILHVKGKSCFSEIPFTVALLYAKTMSEKSSKCSIFVMRHNVSNSLSSLHHRIELGSINPECLVTISDCFHDLNLYTLSIFMCATLSILFVRQVLSRSLELRSTDIALPFEFLLLSMTAFLGYWAEIEVYDVEIAKYIGDGLQLSVPKFDNFGVLFLDAFALALLTYSIHSNISSDTAREQNSELNENRETATLVSIGIFSSFFSAHPSGQSRNRNQIGINAGANSVVTNLVILLILLPMTIWTQSVFCYVPVCVFSAIIFNGIGEYLREMKSLPFWWYTSRTDVAIFVFSALYSCFSSDTSFALFLSIGFGLFTVICRIQLPKFEHIINVNGSGYYAEKGCYDSLLLEEQGLSIVRFEAPLLYHNVDQFRSDIRNACKEIRGHLFNVEMRSRAASLKSNMTLASGIEVPTRVTLLISGEFGPNYEITSIHQPITRVLIIDFSSIAIVDSSGLVAMRELFEELNKQKIRLLFACVNSTIRHRFKISGGFESVSKRHFFPSIHDAVLSVQQMSPTVPNIHMSASMNGCRDIIGLSKASSNQDLLSHHQIFLGDDSRPQTSQRLFMDQFIDRKPMKEDPANLLRATIVSTSIHDHVEYVIECCYHVCSSNSWTVKRRYNDFDQLHKNLQHFGFKLSLPGKKFFGNFAESFIQQRKLQLQEFLDNITIHPLIYCSPVVAQFLELTEEPLKEYENYVLISARNRPNYRLKGILHGCSWRFYKLFALLNDVGRIEDPNYFVLSWMKFGPDSCVDGSRKSLAVVNDCLKFLRTFNSLYLSKSVDSYADNHGIGVITNHVNQGSLRDRLYNSKPEDTFIRKYSINRDCYVIGKADAIYIGRQLLEVISVLNEINFPFYNFHCGNLLITEECVEIIDLEFALAGQSTFNRHSLIRSKVQTVAEMRLFSFAHCLYEMLTGTIVFPDHDMTTAIDNVPVEIFELICNIIKPKDRIPTVAELISLPLFDGYKVKTCEKQTISIAKDVQDHFLAVTAKIEQRLKADRANYYLNVQRDYVNRFLNSDEEKSRRRTIIQEHLRLQKQDETQRPTTANSTPT